MEFKGGTINHISHKHVEGRYGASGGHWFGLYETLLSFHEIRI